ADGNSDVLGQMIQVVSEPVDELRLFAVDLVRVHPVAVVDGWSDDQPVVAVGGWQHARGELFTAATHAVQRDQHLEWRTGRDVAGDGEKNAGHIGRKCGSDR